MAEVVDNRLRSRGLGGVGVGGFGLASGHVGLHNGDEEGGQGAGRPLGDFQGIYKRENPEDFVRRVLFQRSLAPNTSISPAEMTEIVSRVIACGDDHDVYLDSPSMKAAQGRPAAGLRRSGRRWPFIPFTAPSDWHRGVPSCLVRIP
jgi:hypothetical protein